MGINVKDELLLDIVRSYVPSIQLYIKSIRPKHIIREIDWGQVKLEPNGTRFAYSYSTKYVNIKGLPDIRMEISIEHIKSLDDYLFKIGLTILNSYHCLYTFTMVEKVNVFLPEQIFKDRAVVQLDESVCKKGTPQEWKRTRLFKFYVKLFKKNPDMAIRALTVDEKVCPTRTAAIKYVLGID